MDDLVKCGFDPEGTRVPLEDQEPGRAQMAQAEALGFRRLGVKWEDTGRGTRTQEVVYASPEHRCFLTWFKGSGGTTLVYAFTAFDDGALVLTASGGAWPSLDRPTAIRSVLPVGGVDAVLSRHTLSVKTMEERGHAPPKRFDQAARLEATRIYYRNEDINFRGTLAARKLYSADMAASVVLVGCYIAARVASETHAVVSAAAALACTAVLAHVVLAAVVSRRTPGAQFPWTHVATNVAIAALVVLRAVK